VKITLSLIEAGKSLRGGWTREQVELLGESWPIRPNWQTKAVGRTIKPDDAERFLDLRGTTERKARRSPVKNVLPFPQGFPAKDETAIASFHVYLTRLDREVLREALPVLSYVIASAGERIKP
jgi:hypothetical protein